MEGSVSLSRPQITLDRALGEVLVGPTLALVSVGSRRRRLPSTILDQEGRSAQVRGLNILLEAEKTFLLLQELPGPELGGSWDLRSVVEASPNPAWEVVDTTTNPWVEVGL